MFLTGKRTMMCLIFKKGLFDWRRWCVTSLTNNLNVVLLHGWLTAAMGLSKPNQKVEKGRTFPVPAPPKKQQTLQVWKMILQPLGASEAASCASYESYWISKGFTHPKDIKLAGQAIKAIGVASGSTSRQTWYPNHKFEKGICFLEKSSIILKTISLPSRQTNISRTICDWNQRNQQRLIFNTLFTC